MRLTLSRLSLHILMSFAFGLSPLAESVAFAGDAPPACRPKNYKKVCVDEAATAEAKAQTTLGGAMGTGLNGGAKGSKEAYCQAEQDINVVIEDCSKLQNDCKKDCGSNKEQECKKEVKSAADGLVASAQSYQQHCLASGNTDVASKGDTPEPAPSPTPAAGGSGLMGSLLPLAAGAAIGFGLATLLNKDKEQEVPAPATASSAILPNGAVDCSKDDAYQYSGCDSYLTNSCMSQNSMAQMTPLCQAFQGRYCGTGGVASSGGGAVQVQLENGAVVQIALGATGAGSSSPYCSNALANNYCRGGGRDQCPACTQLATSQSAACVADPTLCLAQNSPEQLAALRNSCPGDPVLNSAPMLAAYQAPAGAPAVVLPQSVGANAAGTPSGTTPASVGSSATSGYAPSSVGGSAAGGSSREGQMKYVAGGTGSGTSGVGATGSSGLSGSANSAGRSREVAGVGGGYRTASVAGPASDVQGQYGPNLFVTSSQVIKQRCQMRRFNNCP